MKLWLLVSLLSTVWSKSIDLDSLYLEEQLYSAAYNATMEWGTYKPNQFFGIKNRSPHPVTVGMVWAVPDEARRGFALRHTYRYQSGDGVTAYFEFHDGWSASRQVVEDPSANARVTVDFAKLLAQAEDGDISSQWKAVVTVKAIDPAKTVAMVPFFYLTAEKGSFGVSQVAGAEEGTARLLKVSRESEFFEFMSLDETSFNIIGLRRRDSIPLWNVEKYFERKLRDVIMGSSGMEPQSDLIAVRLKQPMQEETKFIIAYQKKKYSSDEEFQKDTVLLKDSSKVILEDFQALMKLKRRQFDTKFSAVFNLNQERFEQDDTLKTFKDKGLQFSKEALSNLLGGIGYYYGPVKIKQGGKGVYDEPAELFTGSPSRSRFPRGFLWDEGFHLMITCQWSRFLCMDILSNWFNSMKPNGWIPREQIRGAEAESAVPSEFVV